jgi:hypothetical protein
MFMASDMPKNIPHIPCSESVPTLELGLKNHFGMIPIARQIPATWLKVFGSFSLGNIFMIIAAPLRLVR